MSSNIARGEEKEDTTSSADKDPEVGELSTTAHSNNRRRRSGLKLVAYGSYVEHIKKLGRQSESSEVELEEDINMDQVLEEDLASNASSSIGSEAVETFLDENSQFLEDYIKRKVHRSKLERWLFRPSSSSSGSTIHTVASASNLQQRKSTLPSLSFTSAPPSDNASANSRIKRQRSRSFTPLRRLSATKFEESGLSTPIVVTDIDGLPTFLRTSPKTSTSSELSAASASGSSSNVEGSTTLYSLLEDIFKESEVSSVLTKASRSIKAMTGCHKVSFLLTNPEHPFSGDLHVIGDQDDYQVSKCSASRIMTGVITSKQIIRSGSEDIECCITAPLLSTSNSQTMGCVQLSKKAGNFSNEDEASLDAVARFVALALVLANERKGMTLELARSEVFLELAHTVFAEQGRIEPTIKAILSSFLTVIDCERCQVILVDSDSNSDIGTSDRVSFGRVFDLQRSDLDEEGNIRGEEEEGRFEGRFPINVMVAGEVAATGKKVNIADGAKDDRMTFPGDPSVNPPPRSLLCIPIRCGQSSGSSSVLGVISLINKESPASSSFTANDERFADAFSVFCAMAVRNAREYERAVVAEARLSVAFDVMNYQASATEEEALTLSRLPVPSASTLDLKSLSYSYLNTDTDTQLLSSVRMMTDLGLVSHFNLDNVTLCRWLMTVRRNYRNETVPYHNWTHAYNVAQTMFAMLRKVGWDAQFSQIKTNNPLATLYASSTLERHHLNQCLLLLNIPGNRILENISEDDYAPVLSVIERSILATDLAQHFRHLSDITELASRCKKSKNSHLDLSVIEDRTTLQALLMTAADLGAVTKPWKVQMHVSQLVADEFWAQGDLERETFGERPQPMMDREASLAKVQLQFIDGVCREVYASLDSISSGKLGQLVKTMEENRLKWEEEQDEEKKNKSKVNKKGRNL